LVERFVKGYTFGFRPEQYCLLIITGFAWAAELWALVGIG
jgi:hypothetical protein